MGSLNALSFFFRTGGWGSLLGGLDARNEAIGFPFEVWHAGNMYGGLFVNYVGLLLNLSIGLAICVAIGLGTLTQTRWLNRMISDIESRVGEREKQQFQFSLRGLMLATVLAALLSAMARSFAARSEFLMAIYLFGPVTLVLLAMLPRWISWQQRVAIITPATLILIGVAIGIGSALEIEFDKVLMGIFVCWVPQSGLAALLLTLGILAVHFRRHAWSP